MGRTSHGQPCLLFGMSACTATAYRRGKQTEEVDEMICRRPQCSVAGSWLVPRQLRERRGEPIARRGRLCIYAQMFIMKACDDTSGTSIDSSHVDEELEVAAQLPRLLTRFSSV